MRGKDISRYYDRLTPKERFETFIEALARDDIQEAQKLDHSCQQKTYTMSDAEFIDLIDASEKITLIFCMEIAFYLGQLQLLKMQKEIQQDNKMVNIIKKKCESKITVILEGFKRFCNAHIGIAGEIMIKAWVPFVMDHIQRIDETVEIDPIEIEKNENIFFRIWQREF